ncbi:toll/interleukin-1 receptor domain-containing adapter protein isoform 1-T2 [Anomaloglossus baeobatrachus]|uniref:toll/interleukin-1 receptor domain-containing adapter protein n=1 Tax=Anomaloglossus baeobatrachus TaxID=238106 RepID=UPI003F5023F3
MGSRESKLRSPPRIPTSPDHGIRTVTSGHSMAMKPVQSSPAAVIPVWPDSSVRWQSPYDVYICHSEADCSYAMEMLSYLEQQPEKLRCFLPMRDMVAGGPIPSEMCSGLESSHCWVMLMTPQFLTDNWCKYQMHQFLAQAPCSNGRLIPVIIGLSFAQYPTVVKHMYAIKGALNDHRVFSKVKEAIVAYLKEMITVTSDHIPAHLPRCRTPESSQSTSNPVENSLVESGVNHEPTSNRTIISSVTQEPTSERTIRSLMTLEATSERTITIPMTQESTGHRTISSTVTLEPTGERIISSSVTQETNGYRTISSSMNQEPTSERTIRSPMAQEPTSERTIHSSVTQEPTGNVFMSGSMTRQETTSDVSMTGSMARQETTSDVSMTGSMARQETTSDVSMTGSMTRQETTSDVSMTGSMTRQETTSDVSMTGSMTRQETTSDVSLTGSMTRQETTSDVSMTGSMTRQETTRDMSMTGSMTRQETTSDVSMTGSMTRQEPLCWLQDPQSDISAPLISRPVLADCKLFRVATKDSSPRESQQDPSDSGVWSMSSDLLTDCSD